MKTNRFSILRYLCMIAAVAGCMENELPIEIAYEEVSRSVGPAGGTISFYREELPHDKPYQADLIAVLEVPPGVVSEETVFNLKNTGSISDPEWELSPKMAFSEAVKFSYQTERLDSNQVDAYCFYGPTFNNESGGQTFFDEFRYDPATNLVTVHTADLSGSFGYAPTLEKSSSVFAINYYFCQSSNNDILEIGLNNYDDIASNNLLLVPQMAVEPPAYIEVTPDIEFPVTENIFERTEYQAISKDTVMLLPIQYEDLYAIQPLTLSLNKEADIFLELANDYPFNVNDKLSDMKIYRLDPDTREILGSYPVEKINTVSPIFNAKVKNGGVYSLGIPKSKFSLWKGGKIILEAKNESRQFSVTFESDNIGGVDVFCASEYESCITKVHLNQTNVEATNYDHYAYFEYFYDYGLDYIELDGFEERKFKFMLNNEEKTIILYSFSDHNHELTRFDKVPGGIISGSFDARGFDELGERYDITITYELKIISADSV